MGRAYFLYKDSLTVGNRNTTDIQPELGSLWTCHLWLSVLFGFEFWGARVSAYLGRGILLRVCLAVRVFANIAFGFVDASIPGQASFWYYNIVRLYMYF
jgi:hypothetical protein